MGKKEKKNINKELENLEEKLENLEEKLETIKSELLTIKSTFNVSLMILEVSTKILTVGSVMSMFYGIIENNELLKEYFDFDEEHQNIGYLGAGLLSILSIVSFFISEKLSNEDVKNKEKFKTLSKTKSLNENLKILEKEIEAIKNKKSKILIIKAQISGDEKVSQSISELQSTVKTTILNITQQLSLMPKEEYSPKLFENYLSNNSTWIVQTSSNSNSESLRAELCKKLKINTSFVKDPMWDSGKKEVLEKLYAAQEHYFVRKDFLKAVTPWVNTIFDIIIKEKCNNPQDNLNSEPPHTSKTHAYKL